MQLGSDGNGREVVAAGEFGVPEEECRTQGEGDQENQADRGQAVIGDRFPLPGGVGLLGAVRQACRNPCLKAQCLVRSIQPLFSFFHRLCPS